jgi:hypothetical protein
MAEDATSAQSSREADPVVVLGLPRSGTTWVAGVLAASIGADVVHEPDNEKEALGAMVAKSDLGRFPVLGPDDVAPRYEALWRAALTGAHTSTRRPRDRVAQHIWARVSQDGRDRAVMHRPGAGVRMARALCSVPTATRGGPVAGPRRQLVVKSVHAALAGGFLTEVLSPSRVVVVVRHPANVLSSLLELDLPDRDRLLDQDARVIRHFVSRWGVPLPAASRAERAAWQVCLLTSALLETAHRHPQVVLVEHESACDSPGREFSRVCAHLDLPWTAAGEDFIRQSDRPGTGFQILRRTHEQPERWATRLSAADVEALRGVMWSFPHLDRWARDLAQAGRR